jgi:hypothetical protein
MSVRIAFWRWAVATFGVFCAFLPASPGEWLASHPAGLAAINTFLVVASLAVLLFPKGRE